ncbi:hypothetical protein BT63DRAFT_193865 [Microthyrium microscopicum]|uniref:Uncharacterized protein n=1 Tax=Microthyrium microscopicum TaxID=703497 RepID=A0A6A6UKW8_9PEZI|nr:hypothetical protein BT63DRAFT_193865 [Microthyrium microscopicum]
MANIDEQIVSRTALFGSSPREGSISLSDAQETLRQALDVEFEVKATTDTELMPGNGFENEISDDAEIEFRLFAHGPSKIAKIRISSPDDDDKPPGFVIPDRPHDYYFQDELSEGQKAQLSAITLTGDQVKCLSQTTWTGCAHPWRVMKITLNGSRQGQQLLDHSAVSPSFDATQKKARPNKKVRIARRKALVVKQEMAEKKKLQENDKEAALREKKIRRNREKKLKRKAKDKAKKLADVPDVPEVPEDSRSASSDDT